MAEIVLSAILPGLLEKLADAALKNIARHKGIDAEIKKWQRSLKQIQRALADASRKEISDESVKEWLNDLRHLAYDIDDVLDGWATDAMHPEFTQDSETISSKVITKLIPSCCTNFSRRTMMFDELDSINTRLEDLLKEKDNLGLKVEGETRPKDKNMNTRLQTSIVQASMMVGREEEKKALVQVLLRGGSSSQTFSIVPIVGMGGVGKTTLAKLLYNEKQVQDHFKHKAWVCVSDEFDIFAISKVIFQSVTGENKDFADLNLLQVALKERLREKIFLLVLDDVWSESCDDWETLVGPFYACAPGSKIIMTTRKETLLKQLGYGHLIRQLQRLSDEDALYIFARHALGEDNFDSHLSLKTHAESIVKKCDGLPLALIALGRLLRTKTDEVAHWKGVSNSEIWMSKDNTVLPALSLSYRDLSAPLKQLFAYCSLFPKDFLFNKNELVLLWMAEGFLHRSNQSDPSEECLGHEYFDELLSRSFFQHAPNNVLLFVMHDLMNDLAISVAGEFFVRLDNEEKKDIQVRMFEKYRHMSFVREEYVAYNKFKEFERAKSLRTFLATYIAGEEGWHYFYFSNKILVDLLPKLPLLRVLCLSHFRISEVPESIGTLRHLRYLNLSRTPIKHLPESVCNLYNLQTLIVLGCYKLDKFPNCFLNLKNLQHLDIRGTELLNLIVISKLKTLQSLFKIIIEVDSQSDIITLKELMNLCGKISVIGVDNLKNVTRALEGNFSQKRLSELEVHWSCLHVGSLNEVLVKEVLDEMKPHNEYLEQLIIDYYNGLEFPIWVGDPSFLRLKCVTIEDCEKCTSLPPLGQLPALEALQFSRMNGWKKWSTYSESVFPCLQRLSIDSCPNLVEVSLEALPSLNFLEISECDSGVLRSLVEIAPSVKRLKISNITGLNDVVWRVVVQCLGAVEKLSLESCNEIKYLCNNLVSLGEKEEKDNCKSSLLTSLRKLKVYDCKNMERCSCPDSIEELSVWDCSSITAISIPTGGQKLKSLQIGNCNKLLEREWGEQKMNRSSMPMLEDLYISGWQYKKLMIELNYSLHLSKLYLTDCESMESLPVNSLTSLRELVIRNCPSMDVCGVWPPNLRFLAIGKLKKPISEWGSQKFPTSLVELRLRDDDDGVSSCSQFSYLLPSSLTFLSIYKFEKLESVSMGLQHLTSLRELVFNSCPKLNKVSHLQHLTSLQRLSLIDCPNLNNLSRPQQLTSFKHLAFYKCPNMMDIPEELLPSLLSLSISYCPKLEERCSKRGSYWPLISHIPDIAIDRGESF